MGEVFLSCEYQKILLNVIKQMCPQRVSNLYLSAMKSASNQSE